MSEMGVGTGTRTDPVIMWKCSHFSETETETHCSLTQCKYTTTCTVVQLVHITMIFL